jgi:hypothetical protein
LVLLKDEKNVQKLTLTQLIAEESKNSIVNSENNRSPISSSLSSSNNSLKVKRKVKFSIDSATPSLKMVPSVPTKNDSFDHTAQKHQIEMENLKKYYENKIMEIESILLIKDQELNIASSKLEGKKVKILT